MRDIRSGPGGSDPRFLTVINRTAAFVPSKPDWGLSKPIPNRASLTGAKLTMQGVFIGKSPRPLELTNGVDLTLGK